MSALTFDKNELGNLEYSLQREMLATDRRGGYMSTTIVCCNTRKYHGLIVAPIDDSDNAYVLLSSLDETIIQHGQSFNLALHRFDGVYEPRGHKYITDFEYTPTPTITYRVGDTILRKELLWIHKRTQLMIRYTVASTSSDEITLRLRPFLAFRNKHALTKANMEADVHSYPIMNGVKNRLYDHFPYLNMQTDLPDAEFVAAPDWYYNFEYQKEIERGYEGHEDLLTTGYFEMKLHSGQRVIFSASTEEMYSTTTIKEVFGASIARRTHKIDFISCLEHSARQFVIRRADNRTEVIAGYPWYGVVGRETLLALPGITLAQNHKEDCIDALDTLVNKFAKNALRESFQIGATADTPLWFFWTLQELEKQTSRHEIWRRYGKAMKEILSKYRNGTDTVVVHNNALVWASSQTKALTWMDAYVDGAPATPRNGYAVEVNALWYNAVCYTLELAAEFDDKKVVDEWSTLPEQIKHSFIEKFWYADGYLADFVDEQGQNSDIRPNMIIACALEHKMLSEEQQLDVVRTVRQHLLTPKGLRTLSPRNALYESKMGHAAHGVTTKNGSVWVWPLAFYVKACFDINGATFLPEASDILANFDDDIQTSGIGSINEYYDADPPYVYEGATSQASSVGMVLLIARMIDQWSKSKRSVTAHKLGNETSGAKAKKATTTATKSVKAKTTAKKSASSSEAKATSTKKLKK